MTKTLKLKDIKMETLTALSQIYNVDIIVLSKQGEELTNVASAEASELLFGYTPGDNEYVDGLTHTRMKLPVMKNRTFEKLNELIGKHQIKKAKAKDKVWEFYRLLVEVKKALGLKVDVYTYGFGSWGRGGGVDREVCEVLDKVGVVYRVEMSQEHWVCRIVVSKGRKNVEVLQGVVE